jgi:hypothetical protein
MPSQDPSSHGGEEEDSLQAGGVTLAVLPPAAARLDGGSRIVTPRKTVRTTGGYEAIALPEFRRKGVTIHVHCCGNVAMPHEISRVRRVDLCRGHPRLVAVPDRVPAEPFDPHL